MRPFIIAWGVVWIVVGVGALRSMGALWRLSDDAEPDRDAIGRAASRARRWAFVMVGMGCVMALVSPWL